MASLPASWELELLVFFLSHVTLGPVGDSARCGVTQRIPCGAREGLLFAPLSVGEAPAPRYRAFPGGAVLVALAIHLIDGDLVSPSGQDGGSLELFDPFLRGTPQAWDPWRLSWMCQGLSPGGGLTMPPPHQAQ